MSANTVRTTDESTASITGTEKTFFINANLSHDPTTPSVLNTPSTCTKSSTFFYEIPVSMHATTLTGETLVFCCLILSIKLKVE